MRPTIVIAEDHLGCLEDVSKLISRDYEIVAVATDGERGLSAVLRVRPDVVILDISLPRLDGIAAAREIRKNGLKCKILFLTVHEELEFKEGARRPPGPLRFLFLARWLRSFWSPATSARPERNPDRLGRGPFDYSPSAPIAYAVSP